MGRRGRPADPVDVSTAALPPIAVRAHRPQTLRLYRPEYRTGVERSTIAVLSMVAVAVWLYAAIELATGLSRVA